VDDLVDFFNTVLDLYLATRKGAHTEPEIKKLCREWAAVLDRAYSSPQLEPTLPKKAIKKHLIGCHLEVCSILFG